MNNTGKLITESAKFLGLVGREIESLGRVVKERLTAGIERELNSSWALDNKWRPEKTQYDDESESVCVDFAWSLGLKRYGSKKKNNPQMHISIQVSIMGPGMEAVGNHEPVVHVIYWKDPIVFPQSDTYCNYMGFPITKEYQNKIQLKENVLFCWDPDESNDAEWNYSLRLVALESAEDVDRKIVRPVAALLKKEAVNDALPHDMEGLMFFEKTSEPGQYRVISSTPR